VVLVVDQDKANQVAEQVILLQLAHLKVIQVENLHLKNVEAVEVVHLLVVQL
jgi:hypothetical protein